MTREDKRVYRRCFYAFAFSLIGLWLMGEILLLLHPPTELDKKCVNKTILELRDCIYGK